MLTLTKNTDMKHTLLQLCDAAGAGTAALSVYFNLTELLEAFNYNAWVIGFTSFFGLVWAIIKVSIARLSRKKLKLEIKKMEGKK